MRIYSVAKWLSFTVVLSGCATIQGAGDVAQGRQALFGGDDQAALGHFETAERRHPNYVHGTELRAGVLSYLGRAQYLTGDYTRARQTLEKALAQQEGDNIARLYLGLTMYRLEDRQSALKNIESGMRGIENFLNDITRNYPLGIGQYWDPGGDIRFGISSDLAMISGSAVDWAKLVADGESLGKRIEREQDLALQQEQQERGTDSGM
jgi:tetratricopeptide (TPR) repeat protein